MSVIGPGNLGAINLAGSIAGGLRGSAAQSDRMKETASQRNGEATLKALASKSLDDISQADQSTERDADGRMPLNDPDAEVMGEPAEDADQSAVIPQRSRNDDVDGVLGMRLDLDA